MLTDRTGPRPLAAAQAGRQGVEAVVSCSSFAYDHSCNCSKVWFLRYMDAEESRERTPMHRVVQTPRFGDAIYRGISTVTYFLVSLNKSSIDMTSFLSLAHYFATNFGATPRVIKGTEEGAWQFLC